MTDQPSPQKDDIVNLAIRAVRDQPFPQAPSPRLVEYAIDLRKRRQCTPIGPRRSWMSVAATVLILASGWGAARWYCLRDDPRRFPVGEQHLAGGIRRIIYSNARVEVTKW